MLLITCPFCGPRAEIEFRYGGEAHIARPVEPSSINDAAWAEHLFFRSNPKGVHSERWQHAYGCQRWFNARRDTVSDKFMTNDASGERRPDGAAVGRRRS